MRIADRKKFTWRVKRPFAYVLTGLAVYVGAFMNIFFYGYPITLFVSLALLFGVFAILDTVKKGDY